MLVCFILLVLLEFLLILREFHYYKSRIKSITGIEQDCYVTLRGQKQYLQIRGENINNPIILILHNIPGINSSNLSYSYLRELEDSYTVVYWVQRGCGRSFYRSKRKETTYTDLLLDLDELVDYLCTRFHKENVILLGHSCGTLLGTDYVKQHPEKVKAFVSVCQFLNIKKALIQSTERVMTMYQKQERKSAHYLFALLSQVQNSNKIDVDAYIRYRMLQRRIDSKLYPNGAKGIPKLIYKAITSPDVGIQDFQWISFVVFRRKEYLKLYDSVIQEISYVDLVEKLGYDYEVPFYLIYPEKDYFTTSEMITDFYHKLNAPKKNLIEILNTGHSPFLDNPTSFCQIVLKLLEEQK